MYKDYRYINAGQNEIYRYGHKAREKVIACMKSQNGFFSIPADGGKYWTLGTSEGKFGEFAKYKDIIFSVNKGGYVWAKEGTEKGDMFLKMLQSLVEEMQRIDDARFEVKEDEEY